MSLQSPNDTSEGPQDEQGSQLIFHMKHDGQGGVSL